MTRRGRLTLLGVAVLASGLTSLWAHREAPAGDPEPAAAAPAPVSASLSPSGAPRAPASLLRRAPVTRETFLELLDDATERAGGAGAAAAPSRLVERVGAPPGRPDLPGPLEIEYTLDPDLGARIFEVLRRGRVELGHVIVLDPGTGRVHAYASTDIERFPPTEVYPAASLIKVVTAAAVLEKAPALGTQPCRYVGSPYRLTPSRVHPPRRGHSVSLERALATSNNQCFAQLAVHGLGEAALVDTIARFGLDAPPAPGHAPGAIDPGQGEFDLGKLGCGLDGCRITPLHAARLAATLASGELVEPWWTESIRDASGRELELPAREPPRRVLSAAQAAELRSMMVGTTRSGTARRAFRTRSGRPLLGSVAVAGKTGSLRGRDPDGRYEWFIGVAPAEQPRVAIATLMVHGDLYWTTPSRMAAAILQAVFCEDGDCRPEAAARFGFAPATPVASVSSEPGSGD